VRGKYVPEPQFLLDNMLAEGTVGYHVLTALRVAGVREHVLVNRGWVRADLDRAVLPSVAIEGGARRVTPGRPSPAARPEELFMPYPIPLHEAAVIFPAAERRSSVAPGDRA